MEYQYCIYYKNDRLQLGWIKEVRKNKPVVVPVQGKEFNSAANRLEYIWPGKTITDEQEALAYLDEKSGKVFADANQIELSVIHELCDPGAAYSLEELAENFLDDPENGWSRVSLLIRIKQDRTLFQQKKNQFVARSREEIDKLVEEAERKRENERKLALETEWAEQLRSGRIPEIPDGEQEHWQQLLGRIAAFLRYMDSSQEKDYFRKLFHCQGKEQIVIERELLDILALAGSGMSWGRLVVSRIDALDPATDEEKAAIDELMGQVAHSGQHNLEASDERSLRTYTVDNAETRDYDDAVSLEVLDDGFVLRVHIADVASFIQRDDPLFRKGEQRMSSLYTVKETYPMFHPDLSEDVFSLRAGEDRSVMTFEARVDTENRLAATRIYRSVISVDENLTYETVDAAIQDSDPFWSTIWNICCGLKAKRIENGSLELERTEVKLDISDPDHIRIKQIRENTPAGQLIEELAVYANHQAASYCKENSLLCLYRNQPPYAVNRELAEGEKPTLRDIHIQPARIGTIPEGHSALGLDCYMQVTSPIRRFLDLVNQGVIFSKLADANAGYSEEDMLRWARLGEETQKEYSSIEKRLLDHWKIKYLQQNPADTWDARLIRMLRNGKALIKLDKLQLVIECVMENSPPEVFQVMLDQVVPKFDRVVARLYPESIPGNPTAEE